MKILVKVKVGSKKQSIEEKEDMFGDKIYKVSLKSLPIEGKANKELIELLSDYFKTPKSNIEIKSGLTSRNKIVTIKP